MHEGVNSNAATTTSSSSRRNVCCESLLPYAKKNLLALGAVSLPPWRLLWSCWAMKRPTEAAIFGQILPPPPDAMLRLWSVGPYHRTKTGGKEEEEEEEEEGRFRNDDDDDGEDEWGEMEQR